MAIFQHAPFFTLFVVVEEVKRNTHDIMELKLIYKANQCYSKDV